MFTGTKVIWSADGISECMLREIVGNDFDNGFPRNDVAVKLDRLFLTQYGLQWIDSVQSYGVRVFADAKIIEIPSKTLEIAKLHLQHKPWMLNVMAGACSTSVWSSSNENEIDALKRFADLCHQAGTLPCAVTVLTSKKDTPNSSLVFKEHRRRAKDQVLFYASMLVSAGFTDIVCSPLEAKALRKERRFDGLTINTPGVRLPGSNTDDQSRVMTPAKAIAAGADRLVIGRDLSKEGAFLKNYLKILENIEGGVA